MKTETNRTITLVNRFFIAGCLVLLIGNIEVRAARRGGGPSRSGGGVSRSSSASRGSIRQASPSRSTTPSRSMPTRSQPSSERSYSTRDIAPSRTQDRALPSTGRTPDQTRPATEGDRTISSRDVNTSNRNINASNRDVNVNSSNRNVNRDINRDVNVNVNHGGYHHDWDDARRDWMRYRTVNHLIRAGTYWATRPKYSTTVVVSGSSYYYWGGMYYVSSGSGYVVVPPPPTAVVYAIPVAATPVYVGTTPYYYYGGTYYVPTTKPADEPKGTETTVNVNVGTDGSGGQTKPETVDAPEMTKDDSNYEVVAPPVGATVPYLPDEAKEETVGGKKFFMFDKTYYRPFVSDGETIYMVVDDPNTSTKK